MRVSTHIRVSNANEKRIPIEEVIVFIFGSVSVKGLVIRTYAPKRILREEIQSVRKTSWLIKKRRLDLSREGKLVNFKI